MEQDVSRGKAPALKNGSTDKCISLYVESILQVLGQADYSGSKCFCGYLYQHYDGREVHLFLNKLTCISGLVFYRNNENPKSTFSTGCSYGKTDAGLFTATLFCQVTPV